MGIFFFHDGLNWNKIIILVVLIAGTLMMGLKGSGRGGKSGSWLGHALGAMVFITVTVALERIGYSGINTYYERLVRYGIALIIVWLITFVTKGYKGLRSMSFLDGLYLCLSGAAMGGAWYCFHQAYVLGVNANVSFVEK